MVWVSGAGNAALEEVVMALKHLYNIDLGFKTEMFVEVAEYVSRASGRELLPGKPLWAPTCLPTRPGFTLTGWLRILPPMKPSSPKEVGLMRQIVIGKHSGTASLKAKFAEFGKTLTDHQAQELFAQNPCCNHFAQAPAV